MKNMEFKDVEFVGIGYEEETGRVWVCVNGECVFRSKTVNGGMKVFINQAITQSKLLP